MEDRIQTLKTYLTKVYDANPFVRLLKITIEDMSEGMVKMAMPVDLETHTNLYRVAHGGALASLADTAMGVACATLDKRVVTLDMNINYMRGAQPQTVVYCIARVVHNGRQTIVVEADIVDGNQEGLLAKARGTFFVIGSFEGGAHART